MKVFPTYNGMTADRREINPTTWRWDYIYVNKNADRNSKRLEIIDKNLLTLDQRMAKYKDIMLECCSKVGMQIGTSLDFDSFDINITEYDNLKSIETLRKRFDNAKKTYDGYEEKYNAYISERGAILKEGTVQEVKVPSNDIVNAYDMQAYIKLHPEMFKKK